MVVGQHHRGSVDANGRFHDFPDGDAGRIGAALSQLLAAQKLTLGVQAEDENRLHLPPEKVGHQKVRALLQGLQNCHTTGAVHHVEPAHLRDQRQQQRRVLPHPRNLHQLLRAGLQHLRKAAETVQQSMGNGVGIHPGNAVKQQQLQSLNIRKMIQPLLAKAFLHPVSVSFVHSVSPFFMKLPLLF